MLKPKQVPSEVRAVFKAACDSGEPWNIDDTIAAAINAWPGMTYERLRFTGDIGIILPLTENTDAET